MEYRYIVRNSRGSLFDFEKEAIIYLGLRLKKNNAKIVKVIKKGGEVNMNEKMCNHNDTGGICCSDGAFKYKYCKDINNCYYKQLQTAKEENEKLNKRLERYKKQSDMLLARNKELSEILINNKAIRNKNAEIDNLTQQNKQMRDALELIINGCTPYGDTVFKTIAQQALKGGE